MPGNRRLGYRIFAFIRVHPKACGGTGSWLQKDAGAECPGAVLLQTGYFMQAALQASDPFGFPHMLHIPMPFPPFIGQLLELQHPVMAITAALSAMIPSMVIFFIFSPLPFRAYCFGFKMTYPGSPGSS